MLMAGVGVQGSVHAARDGVTEAPNTVPTGAVSIDAPPVDDVIVVEPSKIADLPLRRPRSLRLKMPSANTKTPFTRSGRKRGKKVV